MNKWKDGWFYYKIISTFLILGGLLSLYLYHMISQTWIRDIDYPFSFLLFQGQFFSFFTFQSNFIIGIWFLIATIYHNQKNHLLNNQNITLAVTSYISVTSFVYLTILFPGLFISHQEIKIEDIVTGPFFHLLTPVLMIIYSLTHLQKNNISGKKYYSKNFFYYLIYPWSYTLYLILRIVAYTNIPKLKEIPFIIVYPYLPIFKSSGEVLNEIIAGMLETIILILLFLIVVHILFVVFNLIYFFSFKKINKKK